MYLIHDLGTTSLKTVLFDENGKEVERFEEPYPTYHAKADWAEQDPLDWWRAVVKNTERAHRRGAPKVMCFSSQRETFVSVDSNCDPLSKAIVWLDRRATNQVEEMIQHFGKEHLREKTGMIPDTTFTAPKLLWLRQNRPELLTTAKHILQAKDFIIMKLTGRAVTDPSLACRTMLFDQDRMEWSDELSQFVGVSRSQLPEVRRSFDIVGETSAPHLPSGVPVVVGGGDRQCEALGSSTLGSTAMESTGTTTNVSCASKAIVDDINVTCSCHVVDDLKLIEQGMTTSGAILKWLRDITGVSYAEMDRLAEKSEPRSMLLLPFFIGAKSTRWNPKARGVIMGLSLKHGVGDITRAIMEGVAFEILACVKILENLGLAPESLVSMGGASVSAVWNQIKCDVLGKRIEALQASDTASVGALLLGMVGNGEAKISHLPQLARRVNPVRSIFSPRSQETEKYSKTFESYNELYSRVESLF